VESKARGRPFLNAAIGEKSRCRGGERKRVEFLVPKKDQRKPTTVQKTRHRDDLLIGIDGKKKSNVALVAKMGLEKKGGERVQECRDESERQPRPPMSRGRRKKKRVLSRGCAREKKRKAGRSVDPAHERVGRDQGGKRKKFFSRR